MEHFLCAVERATRFVNVPFHCIVSNTKKISKMSTLPLPREKFLPTPMERMIDVRRRLSTISVWLVGECDKINASHPLLLEFLENVRTTGIQSLSKPNILSAAEASKASILRLNAG